MKLKRIINYILGREGVLNAEYATTNVEDIVLGADGLVTFNYATAGGATAAATYDNTVDFDIRISGDPASTSIVYMDGTTKDYLVNADANGEIHVHVLDGVYDYYVYGTAQGITSATGSFTASTGGTISVAL